MNVIGHIGRAFDPSNTFWVTEQLLAGVLTMTVNKASSRLLDTVQ